MKGLPIVRTNVLNRRRTDAVIKRLSDCQGDVSIIEAAISNVSKNPHWMGRNERGWQADFDWVLNPSNFSKVLEYIPVKPKTDLTTGSQNAKYPTRQTPSQVRASEQMAGFAAAIEELNRE